MIVDGRTIAGLAVPYDTVATRNGLRYRFARWSILWGDPAQVKLLAQHDHATPLGRAVELTDTAEGLYARLVVARSRAGDRALAYAAGGVWPGLSIGLADDAIWDPRGGDVYHCVAGVLAEISLVPNPAFGQQAA